MILRVEHLIVFCPFFFVLSKNEISVQNECVATTDSVVK